MGVTAPEAQQAVRAVQLRILLPEAIADRYQEQADLTNHSIEDIIAARLLAAVEHTAGKPIYFNDAERQELEQILGKNIFSTRDVLVQIRNAVSVKVHGVKISIKPGLLSRLKTRCLGMKWEAFLEKTIVEDLERYVGLR